MSDTPSVGYGKPPKKWQWGQGQSGNPSGRPRREGDTYGELMDSLLRERLTAVENGKTISIPRRHALVRTIVDRGIAGDPECENILILFERPDLSRPSGKLIFAEADSEEEMRTRLRELLKRKGGAPSPQQPSRNRRGRPRHDAPFPELIGRELNKRITAQENGKVLRITKREVWMGGSPTAQ